MGGPVGLCRTVQTCMIPCSMNEPSCDNSRYALAFETSCAIGEVALARGTALLETVGFDRPRAHTTDFLPTIQTLCKNHNLEPEQVERVYVSAGPGSFTGLRIGVTAARMIAFAHGASIVAVPTLEVIAQNALAVADPPDEIAVVLDAKRKRVYAATFKYENGAYVATALPAEVDPRAFLDATSPKCHVLGEGVLYHRDVITASGRPVLDESHYQPLAATVASLGYQMAQRGELTDPRLLIPVYIRPPEAEEKWAQRHADKPA